MGIKREINKIKEGTNSVGLRDFLLVQLALKCKKYDNIEEIIKHIANKTQVAWLESLPKIQKIKGKS